MSPVFAHGRLRLYLLKLLEESPRHGYEVIRLLQDRFMGVYSPSPGTIYPRLARLEEEGLVTHEVVKGKKVYSISDKGRAELERRLDELAELEEEITASAQQFAQGVQQDVRQTVRSLREELSNAARDVRRGVDPKQAWQETKERNKDEWQRTAKTWAEEWKQTWDGLRGPATAKPTLDDLLHSFVEDMRAAVGETGLDDKELRKVKSDLDRTLARLRRELPGRQ
ncbi:MAG: PadR family transcriptional regulator [Streptosporangiaceae bacterium]